MSYGKRKSGQKRKPLSPQKDLWEKKAESNQDKKPKTIIRKKGEIVKVNQGEESNQENSDRKKKNKKKRENRKQSRKALQSHKMKEWQEKKGIQEFADNLKENMPESEKWFLSEYKKQKIGVKFESNKVIGYYIPDLIYKDLIIEIDDPTHNNENQKQKDHQKDVYYKSLGYKVIRVIAWDQTSFNEAIKQIKTYICEINNSKKIVPIKEWKKEQYKKKKNYISRRKNLCYMCKELEATTFIKYKYKTFNVCQKCKESHQKLVDKKGQ